MLSLQLLNKQLLVATTVVIVINKNLVRVLTLFKSIIILKKEKVENINLVNTFVSI